MRNSSTTRLNNLLVSCTIMDPKLQHGWYESKSWKQGVIKNTWYNCDFEEDQWEGQRTYQRRFHLIYTNVRPTIREIPSCKLSYIPYVLMNSPLASQSRDSSSPRNHPKNVNRFPWMDPCGFMVPKRLTIHFLLFKRSQCTRKLPAVDTRRQ